jgi:hypothetical protein
MQKTPLSVIVAKNLKYFMGRSESYGNANALAVKAKVAPNSVRNLIDPKKRTVTADKPNGAPQLDTIQKCADALGIEVWQLLHPDIESAIRQQEMYKQIENSYKKLTEVK